MFRVLGEFKFIHIGVFLFLPLYFCRGMGSGSNSDLTPDGRKLLVAFVVVTVIAVVGVSCSAFRSFVI